MNPKVLRQIVAMSKLVFHAIIIQCVFAGLMVANDDAISQNSSIEDILVRVESQDNTLKDVIDDLESQTNFSFSYNRGVINLNTKVSTRAAKQSLGDVLRSLAKETKLNFKRIDDNIYVSRRKLFQPSVTETISNVAVLDKIVTGKVTSAEDDSVLPGVNILIKGTTRGTVTDISGSYSIEVPEGATLVFTYVGFMTAEVDVGDRNVINFAMTPDLTQLEEIVVVGYGTVNKSDLTGSVAQVKSEELTAYPVLGTVQALQGRAAGVQITANNGEPGSSYKVRVRGGTSINASSDPIYVVDGFVGAALPPPEDIESIEVLKDASATAIYGSRGANGVILVTTRRGKAGRTAIDFNLSYSVQEEINRLPLLNKQDFTAYIQETNPGFTPLPYETDWQEEIFQTGAIQNYQIGISGGTDDVRYYLSGTYFDQKGVIINSGYERYSITSNIDINPTDKLRFGLNLFARRTDHDGVLSQEGSGGANNTSVVAAAFKFGPDQAIIDENGNYTQARLNDRHDNAVAVATERANEIIADRFQGNLYGEYDILDDLKFRITLGASADNARNGTYTPTTLQGGAGVGGNGEVEGIKSSLFLNENYLTYSRDIGSHSFSVMGGYSYQTSRRENWLGHGQSFVTDAGIYWGLSGSSVWLQPESGVTEWDLSSWYGRANYSFNSKYLLTFTARYDGSSVFSEGQKWAFFPSGALAWNMIEEPFMNDSDLFSEFKWRVSYGLTGNRAINPYQTLASLESVLTIQDGAPVNAVAPNSVANTDLSWETTSQFDIGLDVGLFDDRINLVMDYYHMETEDLLFSVALPEYSGYGTQLKNIGSVQNTGFEFAISSRNLVGEFTWDMDLNVSTNKNEIVELPDGDDVPYQSGPGHMVGLGDTQILREGEPVGSFYGWVYEGVYQEGENTLPGGGFEQEAGGEKFRDLNGDGELNSSDRTIIGNPNPDFIWGWNNDFTWKGFDMNIFFQGSQGNDIFNYTLMELDLMAGRNNATTAALDRWTPSNTNTDIPRAFGGRSRRASTRWIHDGSFTRLKNVAIGYTFPRTMLERFGVQRLRIYVSGQNMWTVTDYEGYDPEVNYRTDGTTNGNRNLGLDYASYPNAKSVTFGINLGF